MEQGQTQLASSFEAPSARLRTTIEAELTAPKASPLHRALVVEIVLAVLDDGGDGLEREIALGVLDHVLQVEVLDREVVVAVLVGSAHGGVAGFAHRVAHGLLLAE